MEVKYQYTRVRINARDIKAELVKLGRWQDTPLPEAAFDNMGAFGSNTMTFEQWIQFVLLVSISDIIQQSEDFPDESQVGTYAVRTLDGDTEAGLLIQLLQELDDLINLRDRPDMDAYLAGRPQLASSSDLPVPKVLYHLAQILHTFEGDALEAQLQTFDSFLSPEDEVGREVIADMIFSAASSATPAKKRLRLIKAGKAVAAGGNSTSAYNHEEGMKKYQEEFKKSFPKE